MPDDRKNGTVPVFNAKFERRTIAAKLHYNNYWGIFRLKENAQQETKEFCYFFLYFIKVAANWQLLTPFVSKEQRWNFICKFTTSPDIFLAKGKNYSRKCDCIGCNFEPCSCYLLNTTCSFKEVFNVIGNVFLQIWFSELSSFTAEKNNNKFFSRWIFVFLWAHHLSEKLLLFLFVN